MTNKSNVLKSVVNKNFLFQIYKEIFLLTIPKKVFCISFACVGGRRFVFFPQIKRIHLSLLEIQKSHTWREDRTACQCKRHKDTGSIPGLGRCPGWGHGHPSQYSCLGNPMDRGYFWAIVHRVSKSWTWLKRLSTAQQIGMWWKVWGRFKREGT